MSKSKESNFVVQFALRTERYHEEVLNKRFEIGRGIYNSLVCLTQKRYKEMVKTKLYRETTDKLKSEKRDSERKGLIEQLRLLRLRYGINEYAFHSDVKGMQGYFKTNIDSFTAQKIASRLWRAYEDLMFDDAKAIHYKKYGTFNSLEGKSNDTGIRYKDGNIIWNKLKIAVEIDYKNPYEALSMEKKIAYCRILRKYIKGKYKFYVQIVFKGIVPRKIEESSGEFKHILGKGDVGLDIGTQTLAISSEKEVKIYELAERVVSIEEEKRRIIRKMDRSRRESNPNNFNEDGTVKKQGKKKVMWVKSKHYMKDGSILRELYRKQADIRKLEHEIMANYVISLGDNIYVETMNFKGLQKRSKRTEKNEQGKYKRKKRFGKSLGKKAPAMLLSIINRKLGYFGRSLIKIDTHKVKASQYNHVEEINKKKKLSERWNFIEGKRVQRDMYSAFLIMNVEDDLEEINKAKCRERYEKFLDLHDKEVERLRGKKNISSIAI